MEIVKKRPRGTRRQPRNKRKFTVDKQYNDAPKIHRKTSVNEEHLDITDINFKCRVCRYDIISKPEAIAYDGFYYTFCSPEHLIAYATHINHQTGFKTINIAEILDRYEKQFGFRFSVKKCSNITPFWLSPSKRDVNRIMDRERYFNYTRDGVSPKTKFLLIKQSTEQHIDTRSETRDFVQNTRYRKKRTRNSMGNKEEPQNMIMEE